MGFTKWQNGTVVIGDSISTEAYGTSWATQVATDLGVTINKLAIGGTGCRKQLSELYKVMPATQDVCLASFVGFNNTRVLAASAAPRYAFIKAAHRSFCASQFAAEVKFPVVSNANVTFSGSVPSTTTLSELANYVSRAWYFRNGGDASADMFNKTVAVNETITITNLTGSTIAIGTFGSDGSTMNLSRFKVTVDGVDKVTYTPNGNSYVGSISSEGFKEGIINDAVIISGLSNTPHTVVITFLDAKQGIIDWYGALKPAPFCKTIPVYVLDLPHLVDTPSLGYNYPGYVTTQAVMDDCSDQRKANLQSTFPDYPIAFIDINFLHGAGYYHPETNPDQITAADKIHPTTLGGTKIKLRVLDLMQEDPVTANTNNGMMLNSIFIGLSR
ncbi:hypothetical protein QEG73_21985 [Chitinophagaceae bacterium 26-R-25]|nr:hypothetical protein [Chitinophagaceae bacterium 26-R-25]